MAAPAIVVDDVSKMFRLYHDRNQSLKAAVMRGRRARYEEFLALDGRVARGRAGHHLRADRRERLGQEHAVEVHGPHPAARPGHASQVNGKISALLELGAGFHPELSGKENVYLNGAILGLGSKQIDQRVRRHRRVRRAREVHRHAGEELLVGHVRAPRASRWPSTSTPTSCWSTRCWPWATRQFQRRCNEKFAELRAADKTIVVVSHGLAAMRLICDQIAWFEHGQLRLIGDAGDVIDHYIAEVQVDRQDDGGPATAGARVRCRSTRSRSSGPAARPPTGSTPARRSSSASTTSAHEPVERPGVRPGHPQHRGPAGQRAQQPRGRPVADPRSTASGVVDITVERLMLLPGTYDLTTSVYDHAIVHPFDFRQKVAALPGRPGHTARELRRGHVARRPVAERGTPAEPAPERRPMTGARRRRRIVVATADTLTERMAGPAIRAWRIASELAARPRRQAGVDSAGPTSPTTTSRSATCPQGASWRALVEWCDIFVFQGWVMAGQSCFDRTDRIFVVDVYDPLHLEQLEQGREVDEDGRWRHVTDATAVLNEQLAQGRLLPVRQPEAARPVDGPPGLARSGQPGHLRRRSRASTR